jgi:ABC transporter substrate binding protein
MRRRAFIAGLGSAAVWPLAARTQQPDRVRRIGVLQSGDDDVPLSDPSAFRQGLADLGWTDGYNARINIRRGSGNPNRIRALAQELVGLQPDIIVTNRTPAPVALQRETRTIPIVFAGASVSICPRPRCIFSGSRTVRYRRREIAECLGGQRAIDPAVPFSHVCVVILRAQHDLRGPLSVDPSIDKQRARRAFRLTEHIIQISYL